MVRNPPIIYKNSIFLLLIPLQKPLLTNLPGFKHGIVFAYIKRQAWSNSVGYGKNYPGYSSNKC